MPGFDRSGPLGAGPMTGGRKGLCSAAARTSLPFGGFGFARGAGRKAGFRGARGFRAGFGWGSPAGYTPDPEDTAAELDALKAQAASIQEALEAIKQKMTGQK